MMQIHIDAIQKSRISGIQYVLSKGLDLVCITEAGNLLDHLKCGWEIAGKYNNGVGEDSYKTRSEKDIAVIKEFIEKELLGVTIMPADTVTISFQEFFKPVTCQTEALRVYISFHRFVDGKLRTENFAFENEKAKKVRDVVSVLHMKQDKATVIDLIEKKMKLQKKGVCAINYYTEQQWRKAQYTGRWGDNPFNRSRVEAGELSADYIGRRTIMVGGVHGCTLLTEGMHFLVGDEEGRKYFGPGTRVELIHMNDPLAPVPDGTLGTVVHLDDCFQMHMKWDNGRTLAIVPEVDEFRILRKETEK